MGPDEHDRSFRPRFPDFAFPLVPYERSRKWAETHVVQGLPSFRISLESLRVFRKYGPVFRLDHELRRFRSLTYGNLPHYPRGDRLVRVGKLGRSVRAEPDEFSHFNEEPPDFGRITPAIERRRKHEGHGSAVPQFRKRLFHERETDVHPSASGMGEHRPEFRVRSLEIRRVPDYEVVPGFRYVTEVIGSNGERDGRSLRAPDVLYLLPDELGDQILPEPVFQFAKRDLGCPGLRDYLGEEFARSCRRFEGRSNVFEVGNLGETFPEVGPYRVRSHVLSKRLPAFQVGCFQEFLGQFPHAGSGLSK